MASPAAPRPCQRRRCAAQPDARRGNPSTRPDPPRRGHSAGRAAGVTVPLPSRGVTHQRVALKADLSCGAKSGSWWGLSRCGSHPSSGLIAHELLSRAGVCFDADAMAGSGSHRAKRGKGSQGRGWREVSASPDLAQAAAAAAVMGFAVILSQKSLSFMKILAPKVLPDHFERWGKELLEGDSSSPPAERAGSQLPGLDLCGRRDLGELFTSH